MVASMAEAEYRQSQLYRRAGAGLMNRRDEEARQRLGRSEQSRFGAEYSVAPALVPAPEPDHCNRKTFFPPPHRLKRAAGDRGFAWPGR